MFKRFRAIVVLALFLFAVPLNLVLAQGDPFPNRFVMPEAGFTVYYPVGWTAEADGTRVTLSSGLIWLQAFRAVPSELGIAPGDGAALLSQAFNPIDETVVFNPAGVTTEPDPDRQIFLYPYDDTNENGPYSGVVVAVEAPDGSYFLADIYPRQGTSVAPEDLDLSLDILRAFVVTAGDQGGGQDIPLVSDMPEVEFFQTGIGVDLPDGWSDLIDEDDFLTLESAETVFEPYWYFPDEVLDMGLAAGDVSGVLAETASRLEMDYDPANVKTTLINGRTIWYADYTLDDSAGSYEALLAGVALNDGTVLVGWIFPLTSATLDERDAALEILASARVVMGVPAPADAPLTESYTFEEDGLTLYYPAEWTIGDDDGFVYLGSDVSWIDPYYTLVEDLPSQGVVVGDLIGGLESLFASLYPDLTFDPSAIQRHVVEGRTILVYTFEHTNEAGPHLHWLTAIELADGTQFNLDAYPRTGADLLETELVLRVTVSAALERVSVG